MKLQTLVFAAYCSFVTVVQVGGINAQVPSASGTEAMYRAAADSAERKIQYIQTNGEQSMPNQTPTELTEREINAYLASGRVQLPKGVTKLRFSGNNGSVIANALVDFDQVTAGKRSNNPLLSIFSGTHDVEVVSRGKGVGGQGQVHIDSVSIDGVGVPRIALQFFADRYIRPKHPNLGLDSTFELPSRIDTAVVGDHKAIVVQK